VTDHDLGKSWEYKSTAGKGDISELIETRRKEKS
jgi:hypothetical protein